MEPFTQSAEADALPSRGGGVASAGNWLVGLALGGWACGFAAIVRVRTRGWRRVRAAIRASALVELPEPTAERVRPLIPVRSSPGLLEPGVVGLRRPILLLPDGLAKHLTPEQLDAVVAHEL